MWPKNYILNSNKNAKCMSLVKRRNLENFYVIVYDIKSGNDRDLDNKMLTLEHFKTVNNTWIVHSRHSDDILREILEPHLEKEDRPSLRIIKIDVKQYLKNPISKEEESWFDSMSLEWNL